MRMDVDEARNDVEARRIHDPPGERGIDLRANARDLGSGHRHVHHGVEAVAWIDHMAVSYQYVELRCLRLSASGRWRPVAREQAAGRHDHEHSPEER